MPSRRFWIQAAGSLALLLLCIPASAQIGSGERPRMVALSTIDQTQVEFTADTIDRYIDASHELNHTPGLAASRPSDPDKKPIFDAIARRHGFTDYKAYETVQTNIGFVMAGTDSDSKKYIGRDAVIAGLVADVEKDGSIPDGVKAKRIAIFKSMKDDTPDSLYPANITYVLQNYDRVLRSMKGED